jgi:hypothetical protein
VRDGSEPVLPPQLTPIFSSSFFAFTRCTSKPSSLGFMPNARPMSWVRKKVRMLSLSLVLPDANALADAIEAVVADPNFTTVVEELEPEFQRQAEDWSSPFLGQVIIEHVSPGLIDGFITSDASPGQVTVESRRALFDPSEFIAFCRKGKFEIN